jgi:DNA (cytosine-5)-methyltransferase 1
LFGGRPIILGLKIFNLCYNAERIVEKGEGILRSFKPKFIDLFSGCGGVSLGLSNSGWQGEFAIEKDPHAFLTFENNFLAKNGNWKFSWESDWLNKGPNDIASILRNNKKELLDLRGEIDLVAGGPPCQGFSMAGRRRANDPRNILFKQYVKLVKTIQPKLLLLENVGGIDNHFINDLGGNARDTPKASDRITASLKRAGYKVYSELVQSCDYGVPQYRPRFILIGIRKNLALSLGTKSPFDLIRDNRRQFLISKGLHSGSSKFVCVKDAISDLEIKQAKLEVYPGWPNFNRLKKIGAPKSNFQKLMRKAFNGQVPNSLRLPNHFPKTRERFEAITKACIEENRRGVSISDKMRKDFGMKKHSLTVLHPDKPSHTLTTLPDDILHYDENRILTVREMARIQSFPDCFEFHGKYTTGGILRTKQVPRYSQVGNAVPPLLAEAIGEVLLEITKMAENIPDRNSGKRPRHSKGIQDVSQKGDEHRSPY